VPDSQMEERIAMERAVMGCLAYRMTFGIRTEPTDIPIPISDFADPNHRAILNAMAEVEEAGGIPDFPTVTVLARIAGFHVAGLLSELLAESVTDANLGIHVQNLRTVVWAHHEEQVRREGSRRLSAGGDQNEVAEELKSKSIQLEERYGGGAKVMTLFDAGMTLFDAADNRLPNPNAEPTGVDFIDRMVVAGLPGEYWGISAYPGVGKSALALQMAMGRAYKSRKTAIVSLEMGAELLAGRAIAQISEANTRCLLRRPEILSNGDREAILNSFTTFQALASQIMIEKNFLAGIDQIMGRMRAFRAAGARMIIIDYFQLIRGGKGDNRNNELSDISGRLKRFADESPKTVVVALSQFSNHAQKTGRLPTTGDIRDTGSLGQDLDLSIILHLKERNQATGVDKVDCVIDKGRSVGVGRVKTIFRRRTQTFAEAVDDPDDEPPRPRKRDWHDKDEE